MTEAFASLCDNVEAATAHLIRLSAAEHFRNSIGHV
jgi:hypothetical protein